MTKRNGTEFRHGKRVEGQDTDEIVKVCAYIFAHKCQAKAAAFKLKDLSKSFLNWSRKAERLSFEVPTLLLFIDERLSTKAIIETLTGHKTDKQKNMFSLFDESQHSITEQVLRAYEYQDNWTNRMVLGDSISNSSQPFASHFLTDLHQVTRSSLILL